MIVEQNPPIWQPSAERIAASQLHAFMEQAERVSGLLLDDYTALHPMVG